MQKSIKMKNNPRQGQNKSQNDFGKITSISHGIEEHKIEAIMPMAHMMMEVMMMGIMEDMISLAEGHLQEHKR